MIPIAKPLIGQEKINAIRRFKVGNIAEGQKVKDFEAAFLDALVPQMQCPSTVLMMHG